MGQLCKWFIINDEMGLSRKSPDNPGSGLRARWDAVMGPGSLRGGFFIEKTLVGSLVEWTAWTGWTEWTDVDGLLPLLVAEDGQRAKEFFLGECACGHSHGIRPMGPRGRMGEGATGAQWREANALSGFLIFALFKPIMGMIFSQFGKKCYSPGE